MLIYARAYTRVQYLLVFIWSRFGTWLEHLCFANTACSRSRSSSIFGLS